MNFMSKKLANIWIHERNEEKRQQLMGEQKAKKLFLSRRNNSGRKDIVENKSHNEIERTENCLLILLKE